MEMQDLAKLAAQYVNTTHRHIFLTGKAGTGKTTFLRHIKEHTHKRVVVAAPTGIAAINAEGITLHSLFQLPFGSYVPEFISPNEAPMIQYNTPKTLLTKFQMQAKKRQMIRNIELLIIDEVSMLRADLLDAIDKILQTVRRNRRPFGGVQLLLIGDLLQLPPVVRDQEWQLLRRFYPSLYFFDARAFGGNKPIYIELDKIYRQNNPEFIEILNHLRNNQLNHEDLKTLNAHYMPDFEPKDDDGYITLTTHNYKADKLNNEKIKKLEKEEIKYYATIAGDFSENLYPVDNELILKEGAQIMFIKNDPSGEGKFYNGRIATVYKASEKELWVDFPEADEPFQVETYMWENKRYTLNTDNNEIEETVTGTFTHYPVKLAWAITIHKSQGLTFEKAIIDVGDAFAPGQAYVALSRLTSLDGLVLKSRFSVDNFDPDLALTLFSKSKQEKDELEGILESEKRNYTVDYVSDAYDFSEVQQALDFHIFSYNKEENRSKKQVHKAWAQQLKDDFLPLKEVGDKFRKQIHRIVVQNDEFLPPLLERIDASIGFFEPKISEFNTRLTEHLSIIKKTKGTKKYQSELKELDALFLGLLQKIYKSKAIIEAIQNNEEPDKNKWDIIKEEVVEEKSEKTKKSKQPKKTAKKKPSSKEPKVNTYEESLKLYKEGKTIEEIAKERGLVTTTIEGHLSRWVEKGEIPVGDLVEKKIQDLIDDAIAELPDHETLTELKNILPDEVSFGAIRIVKAHHKYLLKKQENTPDSE